MLVWRKGNINNGIKKGILLIYMPKHKRLLSRLLSQTVPLLKCSIILSLLQIWKQIFP